MEAQKQDDGYYRTMDEVRRLERFATKTMLEIHKETEDPDGGKALSMLMEVLVAIVSASICNFVHEDDYQKVRERFGRELARNMETLLREKARADALALNQVKGSA